MKTDAQLVASVRDNKALHDPRLNALVSFTRELVRDRGLVSEYAKAEFLRQGYTEVQMIEVTIGVALKTASNYIDHLNPVEIDSAFVLEV